MCQMSFGTDRCLEEVGPFPKAWRDFGRCYCVFDQKTTNGSKNKLNQNDKMKNVTAALRINETKS